jgi:regulator of protease activity HflC (stomatin/prohibitin superfamily)
MNADPTGFSNKERPGSTLSGWPMLLITLLLKAGGITLIVRAIIHADRHEPFAALLIGGLGALILSFVSWFGFFSLQPNESRVLILFGAYKGTVRRSGFHWVNPFYSKRSKISLRMRNLNGKQLKVNDKRGNPIEIAAVVVWKVKDTAQAAFDVDDYENYVEVQSESAVRHLATSYAYDQGEEDEFTLRGGGDEVNLALTKELQERLSKAGVLVEEARITHLAYAPEIAQAMLRRQQAEAIIAARTKIVHGAVSMVELALKELKEKDVIEFDHERKASMVSNLLVVLCGEAEVSPVINTGTLYH